MSKMLRGSAGLCIAADGEGSGSEQVPISLPDALFLIIVFTCPSPGCGMFLVAIFICRGVVLAQEGNASGLSGVGQRAGAKTSHPPEMS